jgi:acetoacetyl-CoA reductase
MNPALSEARNTAARAIPFGRMAQPDEIARAAVFLASDNAGFITGQTLHVNGGSYLA